MRMRTTLLLCLLSVSTGVATLTLVIVHTVLEKQIQRNIAADLDHSIATFANLQSQEKRMLQREVSLVAALPVLKSLMTSSDPRTIRDGATDFFALSGGDVFALADAAGTTVALFEKDAAPPEPGYESAIAPGDYASSTCHYLLLRGTLYLVAAQPLYFGPASSGTRLGYVLLGYAINRATAQGVSQAASAAVAFYAGQSLVATNLDTARREQAIAAAPAFLQTTSGGAEVRLGGERFVFASTLVSGPHDPRVQLVVLKSWKSATEVLRHLNSMLLAVAALVLVLSGILALYLSANITRPLDRLVAGARALGAGNFDYQMHRAGAREIRELGDAFDRMRQRIRSTQQDLLAAERLATIGRMASSISHDLRHYLSAVYANAEFLGYDSATEAERGELLNEIRQGVRGMTDLIDSLLFFSRTGESLQLSVESLPFLAERALGMVRAHPEAQPVRFTVAPMPHVEAWLDALKIERAVYNLLLNACQAARLGPEPPQVWLSLTEETDRFVLRVADNGPGVPESIRITLFQPFVSEGKPGGIGLGLTLAHKIAQEHGGGVALEQSRTGLTVFALSLSRSRLREFARSGHSREKAIAAE
jgi:signal transduction histidine kinase